MIYGPLWRALPGRTPVKVLEAAVLVLVVIAVCFLWLFPRVAPVMPFNDNTVGPSPVSSDSARSDAAVTGTATRHTLVS